MNEIMLNLYRNPAIQNKRGEWQIGDAFTITGNCILYVTENTIVPKEAVWLALTIDDRNPERGLWGMVDWERAPGWQMWIGIGRDIRVKKETDNIYNPTLAILKALAAQEGVTI